MYFSPMMAPINPPRRPRASFGVIAIGSTLAVAFALTLASGCSKRDAEPPKKEDAALREVRMVPVVNRPLDRFVEVTGTLFGEEDVTVAAEVPGRIVQISSDLGDQVAHGVTLAVIDPTDYELAVEEQRAALLAALAKIGLGELPEGNIDLSVLPLVSRAIAQESNAKARLDRARRLYERTPPLISEQDFADIQTQHEVAHTVVEGERLTAQSLLADARVRASALRQAEQRLRDTRVIAPTEMPLSYRVAARSVSVGEIVAQGQPMFRLVASDRVKFRGLVPERFARDIKPGAAASISIDGFPDPFDAAVSRIAPAVDIATRSFGIEIEAANPQGALKPGSFARARILSGTDPAARLVPESATVQFAGVQRAFSVREGKVVEHRVRLGRADAGLVEVLDLPAGIDAVIDRPARGIGQGALVKIIQ
jgi:RND family efflux transporter MFP subunit